MAATVCGGGAGKGGGVRHSVLGAGETTLGVRELEEICFKSKALFPSSLK
jgi:hypothetical protein